MSKFNKVKESVKPIETNLMGERAYQLSAKDELVATVLTTFIEDSYYEKQKMVVDRIEKATLACDPMFVAKLAVYVRNDANMRSVSHLLAGLISKRISGMSWAKHFYHKVVVRPDDMAEIIGASRRIGKSLPNSLKKGFAARISEMDAYQLDKYKMETRSIGLVDIFNLVHPKPTQKNAEAFKRLIEGKSLADLYDSKVLEKEMSKGGDKKEAIASVLNSPNGMPIFNLLRNLRNILTNAPSMVDEACRQLTIKDKVLNSRLLPFRFATAYSEIQKINNPVPVRSISFEKNCHNENISRETFEELRTKVLEAIERALIYSVENIPKLKGNTAILIDHSGSVRGGMGGSGNLSAFGKTTSAMIGNLFGSMLAFSQDNVYIGLFGNRLINVPIDRSKGILEFNTDSFNMGGFCGGSTENGLYIFLSNCIKEKISVDNLIIFSDMVIGSGGAGGWDKSSRAGLGSFQSLFKNFRDINPNCHTVCVDICQTRGTSVFDASLNVTNVSGWSDKIFELVSRTSTGYRELIQEIERITFGQ